MSMDPGPHLVTPTPHLVTPAPHLVTPAPHLVTPALEPGSILPPLRSTHLDLGSTHQPLYPRCALTSQNAFIKVIPSRIGFFDQFNLPFTPPALEPFFVGDGFFDALGLIEPDQPCHVVLRGEPFNEFFAVLIDAPHQVIGHANIKRAVALAGEDVDKVGHAQG